MDTKLLIDAIVQQTTVLIAQLSTAAGIRAPLAHVADRVFVELATEIERQGVSRKVAADMFGVALRTYQKRMHRLAESTSARGRTLWESVYEYLCEHGPLRRAQIRERFRQDPPEDVAAVLNDLVASGLVYATGRSRSAMYKALSPAERHDATASESLDALADLAWLEIDRARGLRLSELQSVLPASSERALAAVACLERDGIVTRHGEGPDPELRAVSFVVPVASERGWEASVLDHFRTVATSIAAKVRLGASSRVGEVVGGATFGFDLYPGHPFAERVLGLLERTRTEVDEVWEEVASYNRAHPVPDERKTKVSFYFGQHVQDDEPGASLTEGLTEQPAEPAP